MSYEEMSEESKRYIDEMAEKHGRTREEVVAQLLGLQDASFENAAGLLS